MPGPPSGLPCGASLCFSFCGSPVAFVVLLPFPFHPLLTQHRNKASSSVCLSASVPVLGSNIYCNKKHSSAERFVSPRGSPQWDALSAAAASDFTDRLRFFSQCVLPSAEPLHLKFFPPPSSADLHCLMLKTLFLRRTF